MQHRTSPFGEWLCLCLLQPHASHELPPEAAPALQARQDLHKIRAQTFAEADSLPRETALAAAESHIWKTCHHEALTVFTVLSSIQAALQYSTLNYWGKQGDGEAGAWTVMQCFTHKSRQAQVLQ